MKILLCDDDLMTIKIVQYKLIRDGYDVEVCTNGRDGLEKIKKTEFDLIITDLLMPFVSGYEIINHVRHIEHKDTPIIALSQIGNDSTIIEVLNIGANDYLTKPFSPLELSIRIEKLLMTKKARSV
jgi:two-component system, OmpR family, response regulator VicR